MWSSKVAKILFLKYVENQPEIVASDQNHSVDMHTLLQIFKLLTAKYSVVQTL